VRVEQEFVWEIGDCGSGVDELHSPGDKGNVYLLFYCTYKCVVMTACLLM
jgi:hypothetical protein